MAEAKYENDENKENDNDVNIEGTNVSLSLGTKYALRSVSSGKYLDGRWTSLRAGLTHRDPYHDEDPKPLAWFIVKADKGFALKTWGSGKYLDGAADKTDAVMTKGDPSKNKHLQFTFEKTNGGTNAHPNVAIKSLDNGKYLDGRNDSTATDEQHAIMTAQDATNDPHLQWVFEPMFDDVVNIQGSIATLAFDVVYAIKSVSSNKYLDGRITNTAALMASIKRKPQGDKPLNWTIHKTNKGYALRCVQNGKYLDGGQKDAMMADRDRDPRDDEYLQWTLHATTGGQNEAYPNIAIKSTHNGKYLDGRSHEKNAIMTDRDPNGDRGIFLQWVFVPMDYKLKAVISQFDFGNESKIEKMLDTNKTVAFVDKKNITAGKNALGIEVSGSYGQSISESFSFGFTESIGISVTSEIDAGLPGLASAKTNVTASFSFASNQQWTKSETKNFSSAYSFTPKETGVFEVGMMVYEDKDAKLPFKSKVAITATSEDGKTVYTGKQIQGLLYYGGFSCKITKVCDYSVEAQITGTLKASYAVYSNTWSKKICDITDDEE